MSDISEDDDATLVRRIAEHRDQRALFELLERHAPKITADLESRFHHVLKHPEIGQAVNSAAFKLWRNAHRFDGIQPFGPWFLTIAMRAALDILRGEKRRPHDELAFDPPDPITNEFDESPEFTARTEW